MTTTLYILAYFAIGFGGVGALVWWRPRWFYEWKERCPYRGTPAHWRMKDEPGPPWPGYALLWPLALAVALVIVPCLGGARLVKRMEQGFTAKLDRLREIDQEVGAIKAERERLLKEAGL